MDRYEEALAKARTGKSLKEIFPELKESEDERVRQAIIAVVQWAECFNASGVTHEAAEMMLAWLEKQKINTEGNFDRGFCYGYDCGYQAGYAIAKNEMKPKVAPAALDSEKQKEQKSILKFKVGDKIHLIDGTSPNYEDDCITIREIDTVNYIGEFKEGYVPIKEQNKWELVSKLQDLKPQPHWKPSEHELKVLKLVAEKDGTCLMGLYNKLKSL